MDGLLRRRDVCAGLAATLFADVTARAQPVSRIVVGYPPGGTTDGVARLISVPMGQAAGSPFIVENRPGANGAIAALAVKAAPADGSTLFLASIATISLYGSVTTPPRYDAFKDFAPVSLVADYDLALAVNAASGIDSVAGFVAWAKAHPERASFGSPGIGTLPHLFGAQLAGLSGIDLVHVPFQGAAPSVMNLLGGQLAAVIQPVSDLIEMQRNGKLRILATTGTRRNPQLPQTPTFRELGYKGLDGGGWIGLFAPAATPPARLDALWKAAQSALADPAIAAPMQRLGFDVTTSGREDFARLTREDAARWGAVVKSGKVVLNT